MDDDGGHLSIATIPRPATVERLLSEMESRHVRFDIYLTYENICGCRLAGFLVTAAGNIDRVIAHCPIPSDLAIASAMWRREVSRQQVIALRIASSPMKLDRSADAVWLDDLGSGREVPGWVFALACIPLTYPWDGTLLYPRPFCPRLFESMARQPQAPVWMMQKLGGQMAPQNGTYRG